MAEYKTVSELVKSIRTTLEAIEGHLDELVVYERDENLCKALTIADNALVEAEDLF